uniref:GYF domain-containing protein n=1 Tax=Parastrongyloides trichosuri TaxID=131310 RepID=A0A0N4ZVH4_PARTI
MSKRQVKFEDDTQDDLQWRKRQKQEILDNINNEPEEGTAKLKSKHTLDSDEEEEDEFVKMDIKKIDGQEEATVQYDGDIKITPFNMKDEEDDGDFDTAGNFIFKKDDEQFKDQWLETVDWEAVKARESKGQTFETTIDTPSEIISTEQKKLLFQKLLTILKPKEDINKALKRLNSANKLNAAEKRKLRWAAKKAGKEYVDDFGKLIEELTEIADKLLNEGNTEAYQMTYEMITSEINNIIRKNDEAFDMFGDSENIESNDNPKHNMLDEVMWEYKKENSQNSNILGPYSTSDIIKKQNNGEMKEGFCRKIGTKEFHNIKRIDFDLYE